MGPHLLPHCSTRAGEHPSSARVPASVLFQEGGILLTPTSLHWGGISLQEKHKKALENLGMSNLV